MVITAASAAYLNKALQPLLEAAAPASRRLPAAAERQRSAPHIMLVGCPLGWNCVS